MRSEAAFTIVEVLRGEWLVAWNMIETKGSKKKTKEIQHRGLSVVAVYRIRGDHSVFFQFSGVRGDRVSGKRGSNSV